jgi:hypothetical protein
MFCHKHSGLVVAVPLLNGAVDRVLLGLLNEGFTQFFRVGSLRKIAKKILKHTYIGEGTLTWKLASKSPRKRNHKGA